MEPTSTTSKPEFPPPASLCCKFHSLGTPRVPLRALKPPHTQQALSQTRVAISHCDLWVICEHVSKSPAIPVGYGIAPSVPNHGGHIPVWLVETTPWHCNPICAPNRPKWNRHQQHPNPSPPWLRVGASPILLELQEYL